MANISKNVMATLLIITILISLIGTWAALGTLVPYGNVPVAEEPTPVTEGEVSVFVLHPLPETTGRVAVDVVPSNEGG